MQGLRNMLLQEQKHLQEIADKARMGMSVEPEGHLRMVIMKFIFRGRIKSCLNCWHREHIIELC